MDVFKINDDDDYSYYYYRSFLYYLHTCLLLLLLYFCAKILNYWFAAKLTFITYLPVFLACIHLLLVYFPSIGQYSLGVFSEGREIDGSPFIFDYEDAQGSYSVNVSTSGNYEGSIEAKTFWIFIVQFQFLFRKFLLINNDWIHIRCTNQR